MGHSCCFIMLTPFSFFQAITISDGGENDSKQTAPEISHFVPVAMDPADAAPLAGGDADGSDFDSESDSPAFVTDADVSDIHMDLSHKDVADPDPHVDARLRLLLCLQLRTIAWYGFR